jgi:hypothetical protein
VVEPPAEGELAEGGEATPEKTAEGEAKPVETAPKEVAPKVPRAVQKRIDEVTWEREEQRRRADASEAREKELRDQLTTAATGKKPEEKQPEAVVADETVAAPEARLKEFDDKLAALGAAPKLANFDTTEEWEAKTVEWNDKRAEIREDRAAAKATIALENRISEENAQAVQRERFEQFGATYEDAKKRIPDFDDVIRANAAMEMDPAITKTIFESPVGHDLAYHLAKNPETVKRLNALPLDEIMLELGEIQGEIKAKVKAGGGTVPAKSKPRAVALVEPIETVGGRGAASPKTVHEVDDDQ